MSVVPTHVQFPCDMDLHPGRNIYLTILYVFFWQIVRHLWSLHMSGNPHHMHVQPSRNIYLTSWFILSVLFSTDREISVVPTLLQDPPSQVPQSW